MIGGCLRERPEDRWGSAQELGRALVALRRTTPTGRRWTEPPESTGPDPADPDPDDPVTADPHPTEPVTADPDRSPAMRTADPFVGRAALVAQVEERLRTTRVVTLVGLGGVGKTRLAIEVARRWDPSAPVWFVNLAEVQSEGGLCFAVARALGMELDGSDPEARIAHALGARDGALLVLDNLEQLLDQTPLIAGRSRRRPASRSS